MIKTIGITGHRPTKLGGYDWNSVKNIKIRDFLYWTFEDLITNHNIKRFITGGALGADQMAFEMLKKLQERCHHDIELILAIPFVNQPDRWGVADKHRYNQQVDFADEVIYVDEIPEYSIKNMPIGVYHPMKMQLRNEYIVNNSDVIIALWNGSKSGTGNCINYAHKLKKPITIINPDGF